MRTWRALFGTLLAAIGVAPAHAAILPDDRAEALLHVYDGGGVKATGPAFLVRKSLADRVAISAQYYVDAVSNASIDVVTTASPFKETRTAFGLGADYLVRDALISLSMDRSTEPDYKADSFNLNVSQDVFAGMTTLSVGFGRGSDEVGKKDIGMFDRARHWQYRTGVTQILSPRWLASANFEVVSDDGYLGNPYRAAREFGAFVPERMPRTRSSRAIKLRTLGEIGEAGNRTALRAEFRHFWDTWDIKAETLEIGAARYFGSQWLADASLRYYTQSEALFFSDNAPAQNLYVTRNRQLGAFDSLGLSLKATYTFAGAAAKYGTKLSGTYELKKFSFKDFTDLRSGQTYSHNANVLQVYVSATY
jgi:uncharacterized protein YaiE (UPF0345 family)